MNKIFLSGMLNGLMSRDTATWASLETTKFHDQVLPFFTKFFLKGSQFVILFWRYGFLKDWITWIANVITYKWINIRRWEINIKYN